MMRRDQTISRATDIWLESRTRRGGWFDIAETEKIPAEIQGEFRSILHFFQIAFAPEIRCRISTGQLAEDFDFQGAQLIRPGDGGQIVRLNEEVRGNILIFSRHPVPDGEPISSSDLADFAGFELEADEIGAGHFTLIPSGEEWAATYDLRSGREQAADMLGVAFEFLQAAETSVQKEHARVGVDNLWSACERVAKAQLILYHDRASKAKTHGTVHRAINALGHQGNVNGEFVRLFNRLSSNRNSTRYQPGAQVELPSMLDLEIVGQEIRTLRQDLPRRTKLDTFSFE